jgi:hypothetical protein
MCPAEDDNYSSFVAKLADALSQAKAEYETSKTQFQAAQAHLRELGYKHPDGRHTLHQAVLAHNVAFEKYRRALHQYNELILDGKLPEKPQ